MKFFQILLLVFTLITQLVFYAHADTSLEGEEIYGGNLTDYDKLPYQVRVQILFRDEKYYYKTIYCGGSIIDDYHVLTAAHCVEKDKLWTNGSLLVVAGASDLQADNDNRVISEVEKIYVPKVYWNTIENELTVGDIAVLKLRESLNISENNHLSPIGFYEEDEIYLIGEQAVVSGYGINKMWTEVDENDMEILKQSSDEKLRYANTKILSNEECNAKYQSINVEITEKHICAQINQRDPANPEGFCYGDSGGPLVFEKYFQLGVVASNVDCRENAFAGIYTRVSAFRDFIEKAVADINDPEIFTNNPKVHKLGPKGKLIESKGGSLIPN